MGEDDLVARLRSALSEIEMMEPDVPFVPVNNDGCEDCATWRAKNHPIQRMCERHVNEFYRNKDARTRAENMQHWRMRAIARKALDPDPDCGGT